MSADRELLKLAAKAAELHGFWVDAGLNVGSDAAPKIWNPLTDDGDALRLAVKLSALNGGFCLLLNSRFGAHGFAQCHTNDRTVSPEELLQGDACAATRRAIVRAAAEIGKAMP